MYSEEDLASAVRAGVLTDRTASAFREHVASISQAPAADEERFRLVTGFNDIFVVIACVLMLLSLAWIGSVAFAPWVGAVAVACAAWGLGEFFIRRRRMALPAIVLLVAFVAGILAAGLYSLYALAGGPGPRIAALSFAAAAAAAWLHWLRFRVPITVAAGSAVAIGAILTLVVSVIPQALEFKAAIACVSGAALFALAMRWDSMDTLRRSRRSDVAFWLHLLAAPLLVYSAFSAIGVSTGGTTTGQALAVVALYVGIALVSLAIDRRALMVSALGYVLYTFTDLLKQHGMVSLSFAVTALAIGSALLLLSAFWHPSRAVVVRRLRPGLRAWLPEFR